MTLDEIAMAHPYFDAVTFPWPRNEAREFFHRLCDAVPDKRHIELLYRQAGGDMASLDVNGSPALVWFAALERLTSIGLLREFCGLLRRQSDLATLHAAVDAIGTAATPLAPTRTAAARAASPWHEGMWTLNVVLAAMYPTIDDSRRIVAMSGLPIALVRFHGAALINWFNILDHALSRDQVEAIVGAASRDMPQVAQLSDLARRYWPGALSAKD